MILRAFDRLRPPEEQALLAFLDRDDVRVRGLDRAPGAWRAGCLPWILFGSAGLLAAAAPELGLPLAVGRGLALSAAVLGSWDLVHALRAARRSKRVFARPDGWFALAWTDRELLWRSLDQNLLARWDEVEDIALLDESWGPLAGSLWLHLTGGEKVPIEPRGDRFAGRTIPEWAADLTAAWTAATGREPSLRRGPRSR